jgi:hypothetical protein
MTQLVIAAVLGFIIGECALVSLKQLARFVPRDQAGMRSRMLSALQGSGLAGRVVRYAIVFTVGAGVFTLTAWAVTNYQAARDAQRAVSASRVSPVVAPLPYPDDVSDEDSALTRSLDRAAVGVADVDPYADPDFKVPRQPHSAGSSGKLTAILLQRSERKARADLLKETEEHAQRSQYDCEAAAHARKYLQSGLDVWGFAAWQTKYFPRDSYEGATLAQCKTIESRIESVETDPKQTVVAQDHVPPRSLHR